MASDMSGYQGAAGKKRWLQESGGDEAAYNRENSGWQASQAPKPTAPPPLTTPPAPAPPRPAPAPAPVPAPAAKGPGGQDVSGFKTYADWQNANRAAGGTGQSNEMQAWYNQQVGGGAAPTPYAAGGRQATQATNNAGFEANLSQHQANVDFRDPAYSQAQWGAWEEEERKRVDAGQSAHQTPNKYNPDGKGGCPPNLPFTSRPGPDGKVECAAKPDDCPDGSGLHGSKCVGNDWLNANLGGDRPSEASMGASFSGNVGGGGGGGVGGGGGYSASASSTPGGGDMQEWWANMIKQTPTSRYTPEAMAALEADEFARARRQEKLQLEQARADQAQRGVSRSANQNAAVRQIGVGTGQQIMANRADLMKRKIDADYQDRQAAIKNAQDYVNSMRDYMLRMEGNAIQREQMAAQIRLAQMNINAQKEAIEQNYQNSLAMTYATGGMG